MERALGGSNVQPIQEENDKQREGKVICRPRNDLLQ
jgi:hypothetical protein